MSEKVDPLAIIRDFRLEIAAGVATVVFLTVLQRALKYLRILWCLRQMETAPCSWGVPFLGHTYALFKAVHQRPSTWDLFSIWGQKTGTEPTRVQIFMQQCVVIADPALMKRVLQTNIKNYVKDIEFAYKPFMGILGTGLVTSEGDLWYKQRLLVSKAFRLEILDDILRIAHKVDKLEAIRGKGVPLDLYEEFRILTLRVIGEAVLGLSHDDSDAVFPKLYLPIMEEGNRNSLEPWRAYIPWIVGRQRERIGKLNDYIIAILRRRWEDMKAGNGDKYNDIVSKIMKDLEVWTPETEKQLCYEIKTFLLAGHETSAAMLTWSLYELSQNPDMLARVRAEAEAALPVTAALARAQGEAERAKLVAACAERPAVDGMRYTLGVLKEALRRYSVVPCVTRMAAADDSLGSRFVPAGTTVILSIQGVHHRADLWPEPMKFDPSRFLRDDGKDHDDPFAFLPFIQGPRNCLGQHLALLEARLVLGTIIKLFDFKCVRSDAGLIDTKMIPIGPEHGMEMTVQ